MLPYAHLTVTELFLLEKECTFESNHVIQLLILKTLDCECTCVYTQ